jgi:hypothetical protein
MIWIEVSRIGVWDRQNSEWIYTLNYLGIKSQHLITARWFGEMENVIKTFRGCLEMSI